MSDLRPKIGISACFFHADPTRAIFTGKTLQYLEQSIAQWVMSQGALPVLIPSPEGQTHPASVALDDYARWLDGLVLEGGSDVWPGSYAEAPLKAEWSGDRVRDAYETALARAFIQHGKPVLGICRGLQMLNVVFGGTLYQDIATQCPQALKHRDALLYDRHFHEVEIIPGTRMAGLYPGRQTVRVNSVHHQAIKDLAAELMVEARSTTDGIIEAVRWQGPSYVAAVQWHPEFHDPTDPTLIDDSLLLRDFLDAARP